MKGTFILLNLLLLSLTLLNNLVYTQSSNYTTYTPIARLLKVPESEVPKLLSQEKTLIKGNSILTPLLTQNAKIFGGSYIDILANKININTIDLSKKGIITNSPDMKPYLDLLSFIQVKYSLFDLNSTFEDLAILAKENKATNVLLSIDYNFNNIAIYLRHVDDDQNKEFIAVAEKLNPIIIYNEPEIPEIVNNSIEFPPIGNIVPGGDGIRTSNWQTICAAGFWVRSVSNSTYSIMTAGHCYDNGPFNPDGSVDFYHFPWMGMMESVVNDVAPGFIGQMAQPNVSVVDKAFILKQNDEIRVSASVRNTDDQEYPELMIYGTAVIDTVGAIVCKSGYVSHVVCGRIKAIGSAFEFVKENEIITYHGLTQTEKIAFQGDSGGPVYGYELSLMPGIIIAGILSSGNMGLVDEWNVFTPIDMLLTNDIEIITVGNL
ncbi:hypothetical protein C2G38_2253416 [Gigaspora rosea]|uniref:Peptidase S1 domain-containing protein n=1 Tax=Gigaspora rosea TaxID=44941 RepID=A0A397U8R0_9GLOM|nr:hypothetical protein C2G38_2253416 [Gigaspora rosea]